MKSCRNLQLYQHTKEIILIPWVIFLSQDAESNDHHDKTDEFMELMGRETNKTSCWESQFSQNKDTVSETGKTVGQC